MTAIISYFYFLFMGSRKMLPYQFRARFSVFFLLFVISLIASGQSNNRLKRQYQWFDQLSGIENSSLYNGIGYVEKYKVINKYHKFFKTTDFLLGEVVYDGQYYPNLQMKYNLDEDLILLNLKSGLRIVLVQPIKNQVKNFVIDGHQFVNITDSEAKAADVSGFYEILFKGPKFQLLEKHQKERFDRKGKNAVYYEFKSRNRYYLFYNNEYFELRQRKDFVKIFPEFQEQIQTYSKKRFPKTNIREHLISLAKRIALLAPETQ